MKQWHRIVLTIIFGIGGPVIAILGLNLIFPMENLDESVGFLIGFALGFVMMILSVVIFKPFKYYYENY